eukprot:TRINITY_DN5124_c0_g2_i1.p2 TRINITY_DN5124_c0_g2~~TRINITY_DN5124_c0_g2_i1.p2  ORF type:complete len:107 (+),score=53.68 TRINITY_DN5124_c0_g2_i1:10-330(+)
MMRRPPRSTQSRSSAASDVYKRQHGEYLNLWNLMDDLVVLEPEDIAMSKYWRAEAEEKMKSQGKTGMETDQIHKFVEYFWKSLNPQIFSPILASTQDVYDLSLIHI